LTVASAIPRSVLMIAGGRQSVFSISVVTRAGVTVEELKRRKFGAFAILRYDFLAMGARPPPSM
jgi:hypothetical protein